MLILMLLAVQGTGSGDAVIDSVIARYREKTRGAVSCVRDAHEITICSRREGDRYRVPLVTSYDARDSVPLRTATLLEDVSVPPCGGGAFMQNCGMVGVTMTTSFGGGADSGKVTYSTHRARELAP
jgi:hypothetical protein